MSAYSSRQKSSEDAGIAFIISLIMAVPLQLWNGFVLKIIWNWFVPNIFQSAPMLNIAQAIGLALVVSIFTFRRVATSNKEESALERVLSGILREVVAGGLILLVGFIVHDFI